MKVRTGSELVDEQRNSRRRVLLSCFACSPLWGSEPGVGWRWLVELVKRHDVVLVTHAYFRAHLEPTLAANPMSGLEVHYFAPTAFGAHPHKQLNSRLYYTWWQWHLRAFVRRQLRTQSFDLIHHLTWGTFRFPSFLGGLGVPLVMGPLGGGESAPLRLYAGLPLRERAFDLVRYVSLRMSRFDPLAMSGPKASTLILCKTEETKSVLPSSIRSRSVIAPEIGAPEVDLKYRHRPDGPSPFRLLNAGRLLGWKGVALAVGAMHLLVRAGYDVTLDIAGSGPLQAHIQHEIARLGLTDRVRLLGMIPREQLLDLYGRSDLFVFPSLHDSSGNVVLESLSRGVPVICLDLGGPKYYVTSESGVVISTHERSRAQVEQALADEIANLIDHPERLARMSTESVRLATAQTWASRVNYAYDIIERQLIWS